MRRKLNENYISKLAEPRQPIKPPAPEPKKIEVVKRPPTTRARTKSPPVIRKPIVSKVFDKKEKVEEKPEKNVKKAYEQKFGKSSKFIESNSPIDRYYKLYVAEPETKVFGGFDSISSPRNHNRFQHL